MKTTISRQGFVDLLRIIACFLVIVNHTNSTIFLSSTPQDLSWYISLTYFFISKIAVPIFFMISGYLMLNKTDSWPKAFKRFLRIALVLISCAVVYDIYFYFINHTVVSLWDMVKNILLVHKTSPSNALWYLYAYLGILLMMPFLQKMANAMSKTDYHIFFIFSGFFSGILPILCHYSDLFAFNDNLYIPLFSGYLMMLFIGSYFARFNIKKTGKGFVLAIIFFLLMVALNVILTLLEYQKSNTDYLFFDNRTFLPIVLQSISAFYMVSFVRPANKILNVITFIGSCTFGIYLLSDMVIDFFNPVYIKISSLINQFVAVIIFESLIFLVGLVITAILKKIPFFKKYI